MQSMSGAGQIGSSFTGGCPSAMLPCRLINIGRGRAVGDARGGGGGDGMHVLLRKGK